MRTTLLMALVAGLTLGVSGQTLAGHCNEAPVGQTGPWLENCDNPEQVGFNVRFCVQGNEPLDGIPVCA